MSSYTYKTLTISRYEQDTVFITSSETGITIAFDPFEGHGIVKAPEKVDIVFISHDHFDHFSPKDIQAIRKRDTIHVFPASILDKINTFLDVSEEYTCPVVPLEEYTLTVRNTNIKCMAVPAYNIDKKAPNGKPYHPKEKEFVGYLVEMDGISVYFVGDSDPIPEMDALQGMVDVLLLPISGVYVMTIAEAVALTQKLNPKVVMPMHFGTVVGEPELGEQFRSQLAEVAPHITVAV